jgi:hypothetical protein
MTYKVKTLYNDKVIVTYDTYQETKIFCQGFSRGTEDRESVDLDVWFCDETRETIIARFFNGTEWKAI